MTIKFVCRCGKRLRARDTMAARRTVCPRCGSPVGVPSATAAHPGAAAGPLSPDAIAARRGTGPPPEEPPAGFLPIFFRLRPRRRRDPTVATAPVWVPVDAQLVPPPEKAAKKRSTRRKPWRLEEHWYQCLAYPFRAWPLVAGLGAAQALVAAIGLRLRMEALTSPTGPPELWATHVTVVAALLVLVYTVGFLDCVLASAAAGEYREVRWPGYDGRLLFRSAGVWLLAFLMGPVLPAAAAAWYWFTSGDLLPLDWLVLGELALVATGAWLSAVAAAAEDGRALSANPLRAALLFHRVGLPASAVTAAATALGFWHGRRSAAALEALHGTPFVGFVELAFECVVATYLATFLWRYLGVACYHSRPRAPAPVAAPISDSERGCQLPDRSL